MGAALGRQMRDDLMAVQVEIDPLLGAAAFRAAEQLAVEAARGGKIVDREGEVEGRQAHALSLRGTPRIVEAFVNAP